MVIRTYIRRYVKMLYVSFGFPVNPGDPGDPAFRVFHPRLCYPLVEVTLSSIAILATHLLTYSHLHASTHVLALDK